MLLVFAESSLDNHITPNGHPESRSRINAIERALKYPQIADALVDQSVIQSLLRKATLEDLLLVHSGTYLNQISAPLTGAGNSLDPDTWLSPGSYETALYCCGAGISSIEALSSGLADYAFVAQRPPGHHARVSNAMGFCLVNNVAVCAAKLVSRGNKVAIIDWDVHHGNGTQEIFWNNPNVLYVSVHQSPLYPHTGMMDEIGGKDATGLNINLPLPSGSTGDRVRCVLETIATPSIEKFAPDWILVSAGFDAHRDDPLATMGLTAGDYYDMTRWIVSLTSIKQRTIFFLEGGYNLKALESSFAACIAALEDIDFRPEPASSGGNGQAQVATLTRFHAHFLHETKSAP